ncbi:MAG: alpha/beta hydrolase [Halioglobus sp.]
MKLFALIFFVALGTGCSAFERYVPETQPLDNGPLAVPDVSVNITNLGSCTDSPDRTLRFNSNLPVTILVHGCNGSAGRFRELAQLYTFHGQQAVCFTYDDRASLVDSAQNLRTAIDQLYNQTNKQNISVIGHSMGGLVARKAMESPYENEYFQDDIELSLVTVSAPLAGIKVAQACGSKLFHWLSLGFIPASCWAVSGDNWYEITSASNFIKKPSPLSPSIHKYLKIVTDEKGTCRRSNKKGACLKSDYVFDLEEQYHPIIDGYSQVTNIKVEAGHVEIVGYKGVSPRKLLSTLQQNGMLPKTPPEQRAELEKLLARLY